MQAQDTIQSVIDLDDPQYRLKQTRLPNGPELVVVLPGLLDYLCTLPQFPRVGKPVLPGGLQEMRDFTNIFPDDDYAICKPEVSTVWSQALVTDNSRHFGVFKDLVVYEPEGEFVYIVTLTTDFSMYHPQKARLYLKVNRIIYPHPMLHAVRNAHFPPDLGANVLLGIFNKGFQAEFVCKGVRYLINQEYDSMDYLWIFLDSGKHTDNKKDSIGRIILSAQEHAITTVDDFYEAFICALNVHKLKTSHAVLHSIPSTSPQL